MNIASRILMYFLVIMTTYSIYFTIDNAHLPKLFAASFFYDKYSADQVVTEAPWTYYTTGGVVTQYQDGSRWYTADGTAYSSYGFNPASGFYPQGSRTNDAGISVGTTFYSFPYNYDGSILYKSVVTSLDTSGNYPLVHTGDVYTSYKKTSYVQGSLVQSNIVALDGTYPDNGRHSDGYWYIKKSVVPPSLTITNPSNNQTLSDQTGNKTITISGTVSDPDNDNVTVSATINGKSKSTVISNTSTAKSWTLTWDVVADSIASGSYNNITVSANDGNGGTTSTTYTGTISINRAPTAPTVSSPNGGEFIDGSKNITWNAATDPDNTQASLKYEISLTTNNGSTWQTIVPLTTAGATSYSYDFSSVAESTQAKIRIRAYDGTNYGPYALSSANFTVQHKYYYDKYNVGNVYSNPSADWVFSYYSPGYGGILDTLPPIFSTNAGWMSQGPSQYMGGSGYQTGYATFGQDAYQYVFDGSGASISVKSSTVTKVKGTLSQQNIIAANGTYPDNGLHSDGFWYVKKGIVDNSPTISIDNPNTDQFVSAQTGYRTITVSGTASDPQNLGLTISATIGGKTKSANVTNTSTAKPWSLTWDVVTDALPEGDYTLTNFVVTNGTGSAQRAYPGKLIVDKTAPTLSFVSITSNNANATRAKVGDTVSLSLTASETLTAVPTITIAGHAATVTSAGGNGYTATYTFISGDTEGVVPFSITFKDVAGNAGNTVTSTTDSSSITFDKTSPTLSSVAIASNNANTARAKVGDTVTVTFTASEALGSMPTAMIGGSSATVSLVSGYTYKATRTMAGGDTEGSITFSVNGLVDAAGNAGTNVSATTNSSTVTFDKTAPTLTAVSIASNNTNTARAKVGDTVTVTVTASEALSGTPTATIGGSAATVSLVSGNTYKATRTMVSGDTEGAVAFSLSFSDAAGNAGTNVTATTDSSSVTFDKTAPTLTAVSIASNNANTARAKVGNTVTVTFTASEALSGTPTATIGGSAATVSLVSGNTYKAVRTMASGDTEGSIAFSISFSDAAGNAGTNVTATTDSSSVTFDKTAPTLTAVAIASNNANTARAKVGDVVTVTFTASEALSGTPTASIGGFATTVTLISGNTYKATRTMASGDTEGAITFSIYGFSDLAGNTGTTVTSTSDSSSVTFDKTAPTLTAVSIASNNANTARAKIGDAVTLSFTASEVLSGTPTATIGGSAATVSLVSGNTYKAVRTMAPGDTEGAIAFSISFSDAASNAGTNVTATTDSSGVTFDKTLPTLSSVAIASSNANTARAKVGDTVTVTFTVSEALSGTPTATIGGSAATVSLVSGNTYAATRTMTSSDTEGNVVFTINGLIDTTGNTGSAVTATSDSSTVTFDKTAPSLTAVSIRSSNTVSTLAKVGDTVTVNFTASEVLSGTPTATIGGAAATVSLVSGNTYKATRTMTSSDTEGNVAFSIGFTDSAGNAGTAVTATTDSSAVTFDMTAPTLAAVSISSSNAVSTLAKVGDVVTITFTASEALNGMPTATIGGNAATVSLVSGNTYKATWTMASSDTEGTVTFSVSFSDAAGNAGTTVMATTDSGEVTFDKTVPTLTSVSISSSNTVSTLAKAGDTVTVNFTASEALSGTPTATIGGAVATVTLVSGNSYKASRTMTSSDTEGNVAFSIGGLTDLAGNAGSAVAATTDSSAVTFDMTAPTLAAVSISSSNAVSTLAKVGDTVTVNFTASKALGSLPTATIGGSAATVSLVSGNTYKASRTMTSSDTEGNVDFSIGGLTDLAGNAGSAVAATTDSSAVTFDMTAPTLTVVSISSNNAVSTLAKVSDTVTVNFTASEALSGLPTATIGGAAATVSLVSGNTYKASRTMTSGDTEGNVDFSIAFKDAVGNAGSAVTATTDSSAVTFDRSAPTLTAVSISSSNTVSTLAKVGDTVTIAFTVSEALSGPPTASIGGSAATVSHVSGNSYTATRTLTSGDTEGIIAFSIGGLIDTAGNTGSAVTATTDSSAVTFDRSAPTLTAVAISSSNAVSSLAKSGDKVTITFTASEALIGTPVATIGGSAATVTHISGNTYKAARTMTNADHEGTVTFTLNFSDAAGNAGAAVTTTTDSSSVEFSLTAATPDIVLNNGDAPLQVPNDPSAVIPYEISWINSAVSVAKYVRVSLNDDFSTPGTYTEHFVTGLTTVSGNLQMPIDSASGRTKTIYVQLEDAIGNITTTQTASILRNLKPTVALSVYGRLAAELPKFGINASDPDGDTFGNMKIVISGPTNKTITVAHATYYSYNAAIEGPLADGFYTVSATVFDQYGLESDNSIQTFTYNTNTDPSTFIVIPPGTGNPNENPDPTQWIGINGLTFYYTTGKTMDNTIEIYDAGNNMVRDIPQGVQPPGNYSVVWDGKNNLGALVPSGTYTVKLKSFDGVNTYTVVISTVQVDTAPPTVTTTHTDGSVFGPGGGAGIPIDFSIGDDYSAGGLNGTITIVDSNGNVLKTYNIPADLTNGELHDIYTPAADGTYTVIVDVTDGNGNHIQTTTHYIWDTTPPVIVTMYPNTTASSNETIDIRVTDANGMKTLEFGADLAHLASVPGTVTGTTYSATKTVTLTIGVNRFVVKATDAAGNTSTSNVEIVYSPPVTYIPDDNTPSTPVNVPTTTPKPEEKPVVKEEEKPTPKPDTTWEDLAHLVGIKDDTRVIDMRDLQTDKGNIVTVASYTPGSTSASPVTISVRSLDISSLDLKKVLDEAGLSKLLDATKAKLSIKTLKFEDAIGLKLVVIGEDGSVNYLTIDIPFLATYDVPFGENPANWGVFKLNEKTHEWDMIPTFVTPDGRLEARIGTGYYKAMKKYELPYGKEEEYRNQWSKFEIKDMFNMRGVRITEDYDKTKYVSLNEVLNMIAKITTTQSLQDIKDTVDRLNLYKINLTRQEMVYLLNNVISDELQLTLKNFAGDTQITEIAHFMLNTDRAKLGTFRDVQTSNDLYTDQLAIAVNYKMLIGRDDYTLAPTDLVTREEAITLINRYSTFASSVKHDAMK